MTSSRQRITELEAEIAKLKEGIYRATLSAELYSEWSRLLRDLEAELKQLREGPEEETPARRGRRR